ncbi:MAG: hypothetical protein HY815_29610 [Candidatus Riflebacteria bacterium]|nr:hypothetical protein [Candidatus Riflebacteria bacterium]
MSFNVSNVLTRPGYTIRWLARAQPVGTVLVVFFTARLSVSVASYLWTQGPGTLMPIFDTVLMSTFWLAVYMILTAFLHLFATMFGGRGDPGALFWGLMLSEAPGMLATPGVMLALGFKLVIPELATLFGFFVFLGIFVWSVALKVFAVSNLYGISGGRALFAYFVAHGVQLVLAGMLAMLVPAVTMGWISYLALFAQ